MRSRLETEGYLRRLDNQGSDDNSEGTGGLNSLPDMIYFLTESRINLYLGNHVLMGMEDGGMVPSVHHITDVMERHTGLFSEEIYGDLPCPGGGKVSLPALN